MNYRRRPRSAPLGVWLIGSETHGLVVVTHNRFYQVKTPRHIYLCAPKGNFKRASAAEYRLPVIGDQVRLELLASKREGVDGYITEILPRRNQLIRADVDGRKERIMAANLDRILITSAVCKPGVDPALIDRYLLTCDLAEIPCCILINKIDLGADWVNDAELAVYRELDIPILFLSVRSGEGLDELRQMVAHGISYLTGTSGVGKSTIINALVPGAELTTGEVDPRQGKGRHTTTNSTLVELFPDSFLVDSPGLRDFYPPPVEPEQVRFGFREIAAIQADCRFSSCLHDGEPGCAIAKAVKARDISLRRYKSYLFLMGEMRHNFQNRYS